MGKTKAVKLFGTKGCKDEGFRELSGVELIVGVLVLSERLAVEWAS